MESSVPASLAGKEGYVLLAGPSHSKGKNQTSSPQDAQPLSLMSHPKALKKELLLEKYQARQNNGRTVLPMGRGTPSEGFTYYLGYRD
ncbi:hypothetical protein DFH28DRAFT_980860 [Melampsora americana]|nr:hypothetical protein DFH28DRAFT_980860 [Melampsora americana]